MPSVAMMKLTQRKGGMLSCGWLPPAGDSAAVAGLNGKEQVIVDGKQNLRPGGKVRIVVAEARGDGKEKG